MSTLARLVAQIRDAAMQRLWDTLAAALTAAQATALELLLEVPDGARTSDLERLRRDPTRASGRAMAAALDRVSELTAIGVSQVEIGAVPRRRVIELARYGMTGKAPALRRHPHPRRLATLLSTVVVLQARATDDAVELFDVLMTTELLARAQRHAHDVLRMLAHGGNPTQLGVELVGAPRQRTGLAQERRDRLRRRRLRLVLVVAHGADCAVQHKPPTADRTRSPECRKPIGFFATRTCRDPGPGSVSASNRQEDYWRM